ncbi:MAG: pyruvate kinase [Candidatus Desulfofervidaceae bacterium]|nr:pyruvate kinase [Candidatus Desulfofervidaceae bacterium]
MKRTKIIVTLGPAVEAVERMAALIKAGCDIARINVAHGDIDYHKFLISNFRKATQALDKQAAIMLDIKGPEIRTGEVKGKEITLLSGKLLTLTPKEIIGTPKRLHINFPTLAYYLEKGDVILLDDGRIKLKVSELKGEEVVTKVICGGKIKGRRGVNIPGKEIPITYLTPKDRVYLELAVKEKLDFIAASFIRNAEDVYTVKKFLASVGGNIPVIAKIETQSGVKHIDDILLASDGIMVARGDLGVEMALEELPGVQKYLLKKALEHAKPAIIATQILESMLERPVPTRAEVSDIANSLLDGADALMLSGETAVGKYPVEAVKTLVKVAKKTEGLLFKKAEFVELKGGVSHNISNAAVLLAREMRADAILCITRSGKTARLVSKHRPKTPIIVATYEEKILRKTSLFWGTQGFVIERQNSTDAVIEKAIKKALAHKYIKNTDVLVVTAGEPTGLSGTTNVLRVQIVGDILGRGIAFGKKRKKGKVCKYHDNRKLNKCEILVAQEQPKEKEILACKALIVETQVVNPIAIKKAVNKGITVMIGVKDIYNQVKEGEVINLDPQRGLVWR